VFVLVGLRSFAQNVKTNDSNDTFPQPRQKHFLVFPFAVRSVETSFGFGGVAAVFFRPKMGDTMVRTSDANLLALYTLRKQQILVANSTIYFPHEDRILRFQSSYTYYPDNFWGLGNTTKPSDKVDFAQNQFFINGQFLRRIHRKIYVGVTYEFQVTGAAEYQAGNVIDQENIVGRRGGNTSGIGPILSWDSRNASYSPTAGFFSEIQYVYFNQHIGSGFNFTVLSADVRKYLLVAKNTVLALQGVAGISAGDVPFRKLQELGGPDMMRGIYGGRFTDKCLVATQAEIRQFLFWRLGVVVFGAMGEVGPDVKSFYLPDMHYTYGAGLRLALSKSEKLNLRIDYGRTRHYGTVNLQLREAF
jgi:outer membrane protein assembly factor BamA